MCESDRHGGVQNLHGGARDGVCARVLVSVVDDSGAAKHNSQSAARLISKHIRNNSSLRAGGIRAREGNQAGGRERSARARHLDLDARGVELRSGVLERGVQRDANQSRSSAHG